MTEAIHKGREGIMFDKENWTIDGKKILLGWAMPLDWSHINSTTHISVLSMLKPDFVYLESPLSGDVAEKRDIQCEKGIKKECTHLFLLDGDMVYYPEILIDLFMEMDKGADLVGGLCYRGNLPYDPLIWHPTEERLLRPFKDYKFGDSVEAGATGAACLLVKREVFEKLEKPWFRFQWEERTEGKVTRVIRRGEDTYFTRMATQAGFKLRVITGEDIGHMREFQVDRHFWLIFGIINSLKSWRRISKLYLKTIDEEWVKRELGEE